MLISRSQTGVRRELLTIWNLNFNALVSLFSECGYSFHYGTLVGGRPLDVVVCTIYSYNQRYSAQRRALTSIITKTKLFRQFGFPICNGCKARTPSLDPKCGAAEELQILDGTLKVALDVEGRNKVCMHTPTHRTNHSGYSLKSGDSSLVY